MIAVFIVCIFLSTNSVVEGQTTSSSATNQFKGKLFLFKYLIVHFFSSVATFKDGAHCKRLSTPLKFVLCVCIISGHERI